MLSGKCISVQCTAVPHYSVVPDVAPLADELTIEQSLLGSRGIEISFSLTANC